MYHCQICCGDYPAQSLSHVLPFIVFIGWMQVGQQMNEFTHVGGHKRVFDMKGNNSEGAEMLCHELCDPIRAGNKGIGCIWQTLFHVQPPPSCPGFHYDNGILT